MKNIAFLLLVVTSIAYSQTKKEYYLDENWKVISKQEFTNKLDHRINLGYLSENDTAFFGKIIIRKNYGKLDSVTFNKIKKNLEQASGKTID
uniref:hypothetical protein n=1 Tax=uncultured Flavobacterium sp. TaxID=165435 RepID=UPI0025CD17DA